MPTRAKIAADARERLARTLDEIRYLDDGLKAGQFPSPPVMAINARGRQHYFAGLCSLVLQDGAVRSYFAQSAEDKLQTIYEPARSDRSGALLDNEQALMTAAILSGNRDLAIRAAGALRDLRSRRDWLPEEGHFAMALGYLVQGRDGEVAERATVLEATALKHKQRFYATAPAAFGRSWMATVGRQMWPSSGWPTTIATIQTFLAPF